jgi:hypothetical protein
MLVFFQIIFQDSTNANISVVDDVPVDSEMHVMTLSILRICRASLLEMLISSGGAGGRRGAWLPSPLEPIQSLSLLLLTILLQLKPM